MLFRSGGHGDVRGRQAAACLLWREVADDWHLPGGLGRHSARPGGLQGECQVLISLSLFSLIVSVFYFIILFWALLKMPGHFQKS